MTFLFLFYMTKKTVQWFMAELSFFIMFLAAEICFTSILHWQVIDVPVLCSGLSHWKLNELFLYGLIINACLTLPVPCFTLSIWNMSEATVFVTGAAHGSGSGSGSGFALSVGFLHEWQKLQLNTVVVKRTPEIKCLCCRVWLWWSENQPYSECNK